MGQLLTAETTRDQPQAFVRRSGRVIAQFDRRTQYSEQCLMVETGDGDFFVKNAATLVTLQQVAPVPDFDHAGWVENAPQLVAGGDRLRELAPVG